MIRKYTYSVFLFLLILIAGARPAFAVPDGRGNDIFTGNVGIGTTTTAASLQVGINPTITAGSSPAAAIKGNLVVDGQIYGDGSMLTGLSGSISGLNAGYIPQANSSTTIVDSVIYQNGGNIGIGSINPVANLNVYQASPVANQRLFAVGTDGGATRFSVDEDGDISMDGGSFLINDTVNSNGQIIFNYENYGWVSGLNSVNFAVDTDNDNPAARFGWLANGSPNYLMALTEGGNLGIATLTPQAKLEIVGSGSTTGVAFQVDDAAYAPKVTVLDNGNVGIGVTVPSSPLVIRKDKAGSTNHILLQNANLSAGDTADISFRLTDAAITTAKISGIRYGAAGTHLAFSTFDQTTFAERLRILGDGNVGIATTTPVALLQVGAGTPNAMNISGSDVYVKGNIEFDGKIYGDGSMLTGLSGSISGLNAGYIPQANSSTTIVDSAIYQNGSNIGIGSVTPGAKLAVTGDVYTSGDVTLGTATKAYPTSDQDLFVKGNIEADGSIYSANGVIAGNLSASFLSGDGSNITNVGASAASALSFSAKVNEAGGIAKGKCVYISGATGQFPQVSLCDNTSAVKREWAGIAAETKTDGQTILIRNRGEVAGVDTSAWNDGDSLYASTAGNLTNVLPNSGAVLHMGIVSYQHAVQGKILMTTHPEPYMATAVGEDIDLRMGDNAGVTKVSFEGYGDVLVGAVYSDGKAFFNGNLGIGSATPQAKLEVVGSGTITGVAFQVDNSLYSPKVVILDNGNVGIGTAVPTRQLELNGDMEVGSSFNLYDSAGNIRWALGDGSYVYSRSGVISLRVGTDNSKIIYMTSAGNVGIGTTVPFAKLQVDGNIYVPAGLGNIGIGTSVPAVNLHVGAGSPSPTIAADLTPAGSALITGNLEVDGKIYGDGSMLTGLSGSISGLNAGYIPQANSSTTIVDSAIYQNGSNIGIGSVVPGAKLDIVGSDSTTGQALVVRGSDQMANAAILDNGNMGIGIAAPTEKLHVYAASQSSPPVRLKLQAANSNSLFINEWGYATGEGLALLGQNAFINDGGTTVRANGSHTAWYIAMFTNSTNQFDIAHMSGSGATQVMSFAPQSYGSLAVNVGLGSGSPRAKLDIVSLGSTAATSALLLRDSTAAVKIAVLDNGNLGIGSTTPQSKLEVVGSGSTTGVVFQVDDSAYTPRVTVLDNGNVGIGSSVPNAQLNLQQADSTAKTDLIINPLAKTSGNLIDAQVASASKFSVDFNGKLTTNSINSTLYDVASNNSTLRLQGHSFTGGGGDNAIEAATGTFSNTAGTSAALALLPIYNQTSGTAANTDLLISRTQSNVGSGEQLLIDAQVYSTSQFKVSNTGVGYFAGNLGVGSTVPQATLQVGTAPTIPAGSSPAAAVKGNLVVDGKIYGDGSGLTGISGSISGLNAGYLSRANTSTTIVDSGVYQDSSGNIGIGTTVPLAMLQLGVPVSLTPPRAIFSAYGTDDTGATPIAQFLAYRTASGPYHYKAVSISQVNTYGAGQLDIWGTAQATTPYIRFNSIADSYIAPQNSSNLGIGIMAPKATLHVVGRGSTSSTPAIKVENSGGVINFVALDNGNIGVGTITPQAKVEVVGSGTTTGVAFQVDDSLYVPKVTVLDNGNVGIGSSVPLATLHVGVNPTIAVGSSPAAAIKGNLVVDGKIYGDGSMLTGLSGSISGLNEGYVPYASSSTTIIDSTIYLTPGGNIGIGTTLPGAKLDLKSEGQHDPLIRMTNASGTMIGLMTAHWDSGELYIYNSTGGLMGSMLGMYSAGPILYANAADTSLPEGVPYSGAGAGLYIRVPNVVGQENGIVFSSVEYGNNYTGAEITHYVTDNANYGRGGLRFKTSPDGAPATRMTIDQNGNVGIGSFTPQAKLEVVGSGSTTGVAFQVDDSLYTPKVTVLDNGKMGVGSSSPAVELEVVGTMGFRRLDTVITTNELLGQIDFTGDDGGTAVDGASIRAYAEGAWGVVDNPSFMVFYTVPDASGSATERLRITSTGNIGVGTTVPVALLQVGDGEGTVPNAMNITGNDAYIVGNLEVDGKIYGDGSMLTGLSGSISGLNEGYVPYANSSSTIVDSVIYQAPSGNIGIGSVSPRAALDVVGAVSIKGALSVNNGANYSAATFRNASAETGVYITTSSNSYRAWLDIYQYGGATFSIAAVGASVSQDRLSILTNDINGTERFTVSSNGNIGIGGIAVPKGMLEIQNRGSVASLMVSSGATTDGDHFIVTSEGNVGIGSTTPQAKLEIVGTGTTTGVAFQVDNSLYAPKVTVLDNGSVGIGTTNPGAKLSINDGSWGTAFYAQQSSSDYFKYQSRTLNLAGANSHNNPLGFLIDSTGTDFSINLGEYNSYGMTTRLISSDGFTFKVGNITEGSASTALTISSVRNVGIGTAAPFAKLQVDGNIYIPAGLGNIGIGTFAPQANLEVGAATTIPAGSSPVVAVKGNLVVDGKIYGDGSGLTGLSGGISGLNAGYIPQANSSTTIVDSLIYQNGSNIGIGSIVPGAKLDIVGAGSTTGQALVVRDTNLTARVTVLDNGNVGIGSSNPGQKLVVNSYVQSNGGLYPAIGTTYGYITNVQHSYIYGPAGVLMRHGSDVTSGNAFSLEPSLSGTPRGLTSNNSEQAFLNIAPRINQTGTANYIGILLDVNEVAIGSGRNALMDLRVGGASKVTLTNSGNIGIGSATPQAKLEIVGSGTATGVAFQVDNSLYAPKFTVLDNGNVGIGTITPVTTLHIGAGGDAPATAGLGVNTPLYVSNNGITGISVRDSANDVEMALFSSPSSGGVLGTMTATRLFLRTNNTDRLVIDNTTGGISVGAYTGYTPPTDGFIVSGNVGVGTFSPVARLQVGAGAPTLGADLSSNSMLIKGNLEVDGKIYGDGSGLTGLSSSQWTTAGTDIYFNTGNVGIGSATPVAKLDVDGTIYAHGNIGIGTISPQSFLSVFGSTNGGSIATIASSVGYNGDYKLLSLKAGAVEYAYLSPTQFYVSDLTTSQGANASLTVRGVASIVPNMYGRASLGHRIGVLGYNGGTAGNGAGVVGTSGANPAMMAESTGTVNDALIVTSRSLTTGRMAYWEHLTSAYAGDALQMNLGQGGGSFSGNFLNLQNNGSTQFLVTSIGNTGIGTSTPLARLEVVGAGSTTGVAFQIDDSLYAPKVTVLDNGNFGIGTVTPTATLQLNAPAALSPTIYLSAGNVNHGRTDLAPTNVFGRIKADNINNGGLNIYGLSDSSSTEGLVLTGMLGSTNPQDDVAAIMLNGNKRDGTTGVDPVGASETVLAVYSDTSGPFMNILGSGYVGVGTTAPFARLQVDGNIYVPAGLGNIGLGTVLPQANLEVGAATTIPAGSSPVAAVKGNLVVDGKIYGDGSGLTGVGGLSGLNAGYVPYASSSTTIVDSTIYQTPSGNIGIGSAAPASRLDIVGASSTAGKALVVRNSNLTEKVTVLDSGNIGIGLSNPIYGLATKNKIGLGNGNYTVESYYPVAEHSYGYDYAAPLNIINFGNDTVGAINIGKLSSGASYPNNFGIIMMAKSDSGWDASSAVATGSYLPGIAFAGQSNNTQGSGMTIGASIVGYVDGAVSSNVLPSGIMFRTSPNNSAGLVNRMIVASTGNVGIGTTVPVAKLNILAAGSTTGKVFEIDDSLYTPKFTVLDNGNVGLGTTVPRFNMVVGAGGSGTASPSLEVAGGNSGNATLFLTENSTGGAALRYSGGSNYFGIAVSATVSNQTDPKLYIYSTGNVGVGTGTPLANLHVGAGAPTLGADLSSNSMLITGNLEVDGKIYGDGSALTGVGGISGLTTWGIPRAGSATTIVDSGIYTDASGNLGIGTSVPNSLLNVNGSFAIYRVAKAADATTAGETIIGVTSTAAPRTITLATADCVAGRIIIVKDESGGAGTNNITIATEGAETIDGTSDDVSLKITANYGVVKLYSNGTNWFTF